MLRSMVIVTAKIDMAVIGIMKIPPATASEKMLIEVSLGLAAGAGLAAAVGAPSPLGPADSVEAASCATAPRRVGSEYSKTKASAAAAT
jgi:hypothetical protein